MEAITNVERNRDLVLKRLRNPAKWSWAELGKLYKIDRHTARDIFYRDIHKYSTKRGVDELSTV